MSQYIGRNALADMFQPKGRTMREAKVSVTDSELDAMGIEGLLSLSREAGIHHLKELACHGTGAIVQVEVESRYDEERLAELTCVEKWEHVAETEVGHLYVIAFTAPKLPESLADEVNDLIGTCNPELGENSASMSLVGPHKSISATIDEYKAAGVSPELQKLGSYNGQRKPTDAMTDRQQEVIQTAFDMGYYDVPRSISTKEVATELGLDASTVAEHLQRAERNVLGQILQ